MRTFAALVAGTTLLAQTEAKLKDILTLTDISPFTRSLRPMTMLADTTIPES